ncbi:MAG: phenylalanine--tRNA ligase beta subunit-related protein, partial [Candidatus Omnitrophica bacterium]|nr:phenylalanine--tRNA ligase beta subunit-related protein [Candidatus Omnitrophota bacterium]
MKVTYNWLKEFVEIKISPEDLVEKLTMVGLEVVSFEKKEDDFVLEIEITSNRADLLSVLGIAREISALTDKKLILKEPGLNFLANNRVWRERDRRQEFSLKIENRSDCPLYTARILRNIKITSSPRWLIQRLTAVGLRPVNNIVDITNYVQLSLGQPLHAFDLDRLIGNCIVVRRAKRSERITTIDGQTHNLDREILVIAD